MAPKDQVTRKKELQAKIEDMKRKSATLLKEDQALQKEETVLEAQVTEALAQISSDAVALALHRELGNLIKAQHRIWDARMTAFNSKTNQELIKALKHNGRALDGVVVNGINVKKMAQEASAKAKASCHERVTAVQARASHAEEMLAIHESTEGAEEVGDGEGQHQ